MRDGSGEGIANLVSPLLGLGKKYAPRMFSHPTTQPTMALCRGGHSWADAVYLIRDDKYTV